MNDVRFRNKRIVQLLRIFGKVAFMSDRSYRVGSNVTVWEHIGNNKYKSVGYAVVEECVPTTEQNIIRFLPLSGYERVRLWKEAVTRRRDMLPPYIVVIRLIIKYPVKVHAHETL